MLKPLKEQFTNLIAAGGFEPVRRHLSPVEQDDRMAEAVGQVWAMAARKAGLGIKIDNALLVHAVKLRAIDHRRQLPRGGQPRRDAHCYAETFAERFRGVPGHPFEQGFDLRLVPEALDLPLRWKKSRLIFVNSMSDLFHEKVPDSYIEKVFAVMRQATQHRFQVLTKRAERLESFTRRHAPSPNVWLGVSVENADYTWRIDHPPPPIPRGTVLPAVR
jgi:hypothetical protein